MILYALVALFATTIGATAGIGGGVIIKPLLDLIGDYNVVIISFISSATILSMAIVSTIKQIYAGLKITRSIIFITIGAVGGGVLGSVVFTIITTGLSSQVVTAVQSVLLIIFLIFCLLHEKLPKMHTKNSMLKGFIGLALGAASSFLGIGGGPINVAALRIVLNVEIKDAARISIFIILFSQASGLIIKGANGMIKSVDSLIMLLVMIPAAIAGGLIGAKFNRTLSENIIKLMYQLTVIMVIIISLFNIIQLYI